MNDYTTERGVPGGCCGWRGTNDATGKASPENGSPSRRGFLSRVAAAGGVIALSTAGVGTAAAAGSDAGTDANGTDESDTTDEGETGTDEETAVSDLDVLNFALTLEHLEAAYYNEFLESYSESDVERSDVAAIFADDGSRYSTYQKIMDVRDHEEAHVEALTTTIEDLGGDPVEPGEYEFPYESVEEFAALSAQIESVGVSAYAGAAPLIENADLVPPALSIHSVEARHASYFNVLDTTSPFPNAFDPARTMAEVLEIASQFIVGMDSEGMDSEDADDDASDDENGDDEGGSEGRLSIADLRAATGSGSNPRAEYVTYENTGDGPLDLTGWTVENGRGTTYSFPDGLTLAPGETVTLYTGRGTDTETELYWGKPEEVWNDRLDTMIVRDASGAVVLKRSYP